MKSGLVVLAVMLCSFPVAVLAGQDVDAVHKLDEIVVTSTRKARAVDTPASLSIITGQNHL
ncbi:MAG: hypothetical protein MI799_15125 [Desulfobacterales bacterium]|nr:hypothetical protein [Desulfobacterales bacterium]